MIFSLTNGLVAEKQGAAISKSPTLSQTAVRKLPMYHGRAWCQAQVSLLAGEARIRQQTVIPPKRDTPVGKSPSGRRVHQPCSQPDTSGSVTRRFEVEDFVKHIHGRRPPLHLNSPRVVSYGSNEACSGATLLRTPVFHISEATVCNNV